MRERLTWIDIAKGFGILLVGLGHTRYQGVWGARWIYSFHMPLFFVMAGLCYDENRYPNFWSYFKRKCIALLYPYVTLSLMVIALMSVLYMGSDPKCTSFSMLHRMIGGNTISAFWFIPVLFECELLYYILSRCLRRMRERAAMCAICGLVAVSLTKTPLPYGLDIALLSMPFYGIGNGMRKVVLNYGLVKALVLMSFLIPQLLILLFVFPKMRVDFGANVLYSPILFFCLAVAGTAFISGLSMLVDRVRVLHRWGKTLSFLGKNSIVLLAFHTPIGVCRSSWVACFPLLSNFSELIEFGLLATLLFLLSGPLNGLVRVDVSSQSDGR